MTTENAVATASARIPPEARRWYALVALQVASTMAIFLFPDFFPESAKIKFGVLLFYVMMPVFIAVIEGVSSFFLFALSNFSAVSSLVLTFENVGSLVPTNWYIFSTASTLMAMILVPGQFKVSSVRAVVGVFMAHVIVVTVLFINSIPLAFVTGIIAMIFSITAYFIPSIRSALRHEHI